MFRVEYKPQEQADGRLVKEALAAAGLSERQASDQTGIALTTLNRKLRGQAPFTAPELRKLGRLLGVKASTLLADEVPA